jgi:hypothetical protein
MQNNISFDRLPAAVNELIMKVDQLQATINSQKNSTSDNPDEWLTISEAEIILKKSKNTIYGLTCNRSPKKNGRPRNNTRPLPFYRFNKELRFKRSELIEWMAAGRSRTKQEIRQEIDAQLSRR